MRELADHILHRANVIDTPITNLQLQKIMYFTLGFMLENNRELAEEMFNNDKMEAWLYGPVVPDVYEKYKKYKNRPIEELGVNSMKLNSGEVNEIIDLLIDVDPFKLVKISHNHQFWREQEDEIKYNNKRPSYNFENIEEAFNVKQ
ncbi:MULTISPECIES: Panacea domain-containing protein [Staphylococcus]|uniref:Phage-associated protein n=1 Tax=Staphylococcus caeli TaxID=2201815 RepID=A0A1D4PV16_9STAP|nr:MULTISPECIES: type II toxin-antitoxin system antitoxin SocA domain-containing protein [Staphylococcus]UXS59853.1 DUF4065 domain-containing protein [Staphylococcus ureilyticus]SCT26763.1 putative phage-associated protein [Staphylococcus caeli]SCT35091.1 putative phage-associated protein [Staphylococcus caeli]